MATLFPKGIGEDYWSLDDILSGQERVTCKVEEPLYRLGYLGSNEQQHLSRDTKLELPIWLARGLGTKRRRIVSVTYPKPYREHTRTALMADANSINLHRNGPYYYSFGVKLLFFDLPERGPLANCLLETFIQRFRTLMDKSQNAYQMDVTMFTKSLDQLEKYLFTLGQEHMAKQVQWESGRGKHIKKSSLIDTNMGSRKRKRDT